MIHRQNYLDIRAYLNHAGRVRQNDPKTVSRYWNALRHLLVWADEYPLIKARSIDPTFPAYLCDRLTPASIAKTLMTARQFFAFAGSEWSRRYKPISDSWIESLVPPRHAHPLARLRVREFWTLENVRKVASIPTETLREERGKVAVCILFLSGMRADALASLPLSCMDLDRNAVYQLPERGVRTKNHKAAVTYLLQVQDILAVVRHWDRKLRSAVHSQNGLGDRYLWYSPLTSDGMDFHLIENAFAERHHVIAEDVKLICARASVPYLSPHKLRHGHAVYALKRASNIAQLKAVSQNLMHESLVTTDQIYGRLINDDVQEIILHL
jgi:site-specific recombinase XerD